MREWRWVIADLRGKDGRIRTVAIPVWAKKGIDVWTSAAGPGRSRLLRTIRNGGRIGEGLSAWAIWSVVEQAAKQIGIERIGAHDPSPLICAAGTAALGL